LTSRLLGRVSPPPGAGWLAASGLLLGLAHPPFHLFLPSFVALVPFAVWIERLPDGAEGRGAALRGGFFLGLIYFALVFYWLLVALIYYTRLAILAFVVPVLILSGFLALVTLGTHRARRRLGWPVWIALPVFWTAMEWLRAHLGDVSFPWMGLGDTLTGYPWLIGAADVVGSRGLTFWLVAVNGAVAGLWLARRSPESRRRGVLERPAPLVAVLVLLLTVPATYSLVRWMTLDLRPAARVVLVQPNIPEDLKLERGAAVDSTLLATNALLTGALSEEAGSADLIVLPETALPDFIDPIPSLRYPGRPDLRAWAAKWAERFDAPILFGGLGADDRGEGRYDHFNSAFYLGADGRQLARYDKKYLVPIVERVPFVNPGLFRNLRYFGGFGVGRKSPILATRDSRFGVLICYESIFTQLTRRYRRSGADFVVNITNDAWFGRAEPWWSRSSGLSQHPAHLVMRSIENRIGVARSANTGITEIVDPLGRVEARTELFVDAVLTGEVKTSDALTLYTRFGDVVGWTAAVCALLAAIGAAYRRPEGDARGQPTQGA
jgi:apolipoprotein N-acyltransferase